MWYVPFGLGELGGLVAGVAVGCANEVDEWISTYMNNQNSINRWINDK